MLQVSRRFALALSMTGLFFEAHDEEEVEDEPEESGVLQFPLKGDK